MDGLTPDISENTDYWSKSTGGIYPLLSFKFGDSGGAVKSMNSICSNI